MNEDHWADLAQSILESTRQTCRFTAGHGAISSDGELRRSTGFAGWKHDGQFRKGEGRIPYIHHPVEVASLLWEIGGVEDVELLQAAVLHDTIEDTETTRDEIQSHFGERVCTIVVEVTDNKALPKMERKAAQVAHAPHLSKDAQSLKLADKICNIHDVAMCTPIDWEKERQQAYFDWATEVVAGLRGCNSALEDLFDHQIEISRNQVNG